MSRAFVKEPDGEEAASTLPDRPVSTHRNFVTLTGLAQIDAKIVELREKIARAHPAADTTTVAGASRDLRYWTARRASAEPVVPSTGAEARFGSTVTIERGNGRRQTFQITGEDEADPTSGTISYVAPLARALIGRTQGDEIEFLAESILVLAVELVADPE